MKRILLAVAFTVAPLPIAAAEDEVPPHEWCTGWSSFAETTMRARQVGVSLSDMIGAANENSGESESMRKGMTMLIRLAFETPRYHTDAMQQRVIEEFRDRAYLECAKATDKRDKKRREQSSRSTGR